MTFEGTPTLDGELFESRLDFEMRSLPDILQLTILLLFEILHIPGMLLLTLPRLVGLLDHVIVLVCNAPMHPDLLH